MIRSIEDGRHRMMRAGGQRGDWMRGGENEEAIAAGMSQERMELTLPSTLEGVAEIEQFVEQLALRAGFDEDTASNVAMATREAAINAAKHGNAFSPEKRVKATLARNRDTLTLQIAEEGEGLDPNTLPDPLDPANLLRSSGRGVFLMRAIMDEVHFRQSQPGTVVTLIKHRDMEANS